MAERLKLEIKRDEDAQNPREDDETFRIVGWHRRYKIGDEQPRVAPDEWRVSLDEEHQDAIVLPVYMYEHGGIALSCGAFGCTWDSGQVGYIYTTLSTMRKAGFEGGDVELTQRAEEAMRAIVENYSAYLNGDAWGYVISRVVTCDQGHDHAEETDACWGFIGDDAKAGIAGYLPAEVLPLLDEAWDNRR